MPGTGGRLPAYQVLADDLRGQIAAGALRPGDRLPSEPQLCARSGVSRSTVREALRLLASEQLIVTTRGVSGGSFVARPTAVGLARSMTGAVQLLLATPAVGMVDFLEAREIVEVPGAALAAVRRTEDDLAAMRAALYDPDQDPARVRLQRYWDFHRALLGAAHNGLLELIMGPCYGSHVVDTEAPLRARLLSARSHREILARVQERDPAGASAALRAHLADMRGIFAQHELVGP
ncbi:MAG TPA: GntR family transcriptional regulator [Pilimelia sp.]|nr:GntR family transcriptional regulator [Pilimelia sp.]